MGTIYQSAIGDNSTTTPLAAGATFTGATELSDQPDVAVSCKTDAAGVLYFDFSNDGTNWDTFPTSGFGISAGIHEFHTAVKLGRYFRVRLVNGSSVQTYLRLYVYFGVYRHGNAPLNQTAGLDQDAQFVRGTIPEDEIRLGRRSGVTGWNKFGYNADVDSAAPEVIASFGGVFTPLTAASTFTITYDGTGGGSTDGAGTNGANELTFFYIDADGLPAIAAHTLGTDGSDVTSFSGLGINRVAVSASGSANANVSTITITATTGGSNQAEIPDGDGVTQQAIFFVGSNHIGILKNIFINVRKLSGGSAPRVTVRGWVFNRAIETEFEIFRYDIDTNVENSVTYTDEVGFTLNSSDVLYFTADTNTDNTIAGARFSLIEYQKA